MLRTYNTSRFPRSAPKPTYGQARRLARAQAQRRAKRINLFVAVFIGACYTLMGIAVCGAIIAAGWGYADRLERDAIRASYNMEGLY